MRFFDADATARLLPMPRLVETLAAVLREYAEGTVACPGRLVVPRADGSGLLMSMPCHGRDLAVHKLITIYAGNPARGLPAIQGQVTCFDGPDGVPLFGLDGPTVTARRTAAVTLVGIDRLARCRPGSVSVIGTGTQARSHAEALLERYPEAVVRVRGRSAEAERRFCAGLPAAAGRIEPHPAGPVGGDVVVAVTSSRTPVYDEEPVPDRLVVGVGAYRLDMVEVGARTIGGSQVYVDDPVGAPGEAGDVVAAGSDWSQVRPLASAAEAPPDPGRPVFFKSVGCAAWDLAACRTARQSLDAAPDRPA